MDANTQLLARTMGRVIALNTALRNVILAEARRSGTPEAYLASEKETALRAIAESEKISSGELWDEMAEAAYSMLAQLYEPDLLPG